ncbi:MAG: trehalose-phosphatase [Gammaproteobacteria bacterium]|jgi:alpha,alpha-trehalase|nr:trehalose-phosphatase [Chromatiaceae bacterium]MCU0935300.1 trehalose-phosphatase [Gammaproteobacteria bacterium]
MPDPELTLSRERLDAVIFDLDGVVTRTADVHATAWKRLFDAFLEARQARAGEDLTPFDIERDYRRYVDGRPRYQGVKHFLAARLIELPMGEPDDPPDRETICGLGNRKNRIFQKLVEEQGVEVYGCAVALLHRLRRAGFRTAVVSASKNCALILEQAGLADLFDARVDGVEAERLDLDGKPDPDTFLEAARRLGVEPRRAAVLEDAIAGVAAGSRGHFGLVIGVDRDNQTDALSEAGADRVFGDLCWIEVEGAEARVPPPLEDPERISDRLADKRPALFLDYDGTLTPIVERPEDAKLSEDMRRTLRDAPRAMPVAVISGRDLEDVRALVGVPEMVYAGSHGFDILGPDLRLELPEGVDALDDLERAAGALEERLADIPGARLERKRFAIAVHYRQVAEEDAPRVGSAVEAVRERFEGLRRTGGKKVFELRPDIDWDKGRAVRWLLAELGLDGPDVLPVYIGDDLTDEDAFEALHGRGIGILVAERPQPSAADYRLEDTDRVAELLRHLIDTETADE